MLHVSACSLLRQFSGMSTQEYTLKDRITAVYILLYVFCVDMTQDGLSIGHFQKCQHKNIHGKIG
jgi:hypothetical protein